MVGSSTMIVTVGGRGRYTYSAEIGGVEYRIRCASQAAAAKKLHRYFLSVGHNLPETWRLSLTFHRNEIDYWEVNSEGEIQ